MYRIGGRVVLAVDDAYAGVVCEVDSINSQAVRFMVLAKAAALPGDSTPATLRDLYEVFETVGRPTWNLADPAGAISPTAAGMLRVPEPLMFRLIDRWTDTLPREEPDAE